MRAHPDHRQQAALDWIVRTNDPAFEAWDDFTLWLEADPANADIYHQLADSEIALRPMVEAVTVADHAARPAPRNRSRVRMAIAASVAVLAIATTTLVGPRLIPTEYSTGPGELRTVSLGGADKLVMNGDTKLTLSGFNRRDVNLAQGQIYLSLDDEGRGQVDVRSGDLRLVDVGTRFEVSRDGRATRVLVSDGAVVVDPGGADLRLTVGQQLDAGDGATILRPVAANPTSAGSFERGQLVYSNESLERVAIDLRRSTGIDFSTSRAISAQRFSGTLSVSEVKRDPSSLGPLLGVTMRQSPQGWTLGISE